MTTKNRTITVSYPHYQDGLIGNARLSAPFVYKVEKVTDSVEFSPGDKLTRKQVDELCSIGTWKVTIVPVKP